MTSYSKKYERVLKSFSASKQSYNTLLGNADDVFLILEIIYDETGQPIDGIKTKEDYPAAKLSNLKTDEFYEKIKEFFPFTEDHWFAEWDKVLKTGKPSHLQAYHFDSDSWFDIFSFPHSPGRVGILFRNITKIKKLELDKKLTALIMATSELIYQMNPDWSEMIQLNSRGFLKNTLGPDDNWFKSYIPPEDQEFVLSSISNAINKKEIFELEHRVYRQDGSIGWVHSRAVPLLNDNGDITEWVGAANDITNRKLAEEELLNRQHELSQLVELKDEFLSIISHEFKTPLNVIFSAIQMMEHRYFSELSVKGKDLLFKIKQNSFRQMRLVNNLLDMTRANAGRMKMELSNKDIVYYTKAITKSVEVYAKQKDIVIEFSSAMKRKMIAIDEEFYERILLNLLSNAIKFTQNGSTIQVKLFKKTVNQDSMICLQVSDQGLGIPEDKINIIFERFGQVDSKLTRQAEGTGIGLSLVKMLVELLGGTISLDSKLGYGSTFSVLLPDRTVKEQFGKMEDKSFNDRLIHSIEVEFSDIYLHI